MRKADPIAETAQQHLTRAVPAFARETPVGQVRQTMAAADYDEWDWIYGIDGEGGLAGQVGVGALLAADPALPLAALLQPATVTARPGDHQERVARAALAGRLDVIPVVGQDGRFLGVVPPLALIDVLAREHEEDMDRLAGIRRRVAPVLAALSEPPLHSMARRLPWLLVGLAGALGSALLVSGFESVLRQSVALAFFVPAVVYLADAVGTQTETLMVRGLAVAQAASRRLFLTELATGALIGLVLGLFAFPLVWWLFANTALALTVALAILVACTVATSIGALLPWLIGRLHFDPALGSGPLATVIQDVLSLIIYFALGTLLL
ncbi:MAG TPA: magnesium transporter [Kiloniellales bacterium]|nr:magnesium transporter [Kiloniellales bacterium]